MIQVYGQKTSSKHCNDTNPKQAEYNQMLRNIEQ